jgi:hypothetical protein
MWNKKSLQKDHFFHDSALLDGLNMSQIAPIQMFRLTPHDCPDIFNYYNLAITAKQIYSTPKKEEWISHRMFYLVF